MTKTIQEGTYCLDSNGIFVRVIEFYTDTMVWAQTEGNKDVDDGNVYLYCVSELTFLNNDYIEQEKASDEMVRINHK